MISVWMKSLGVRSSNLFITRNNFLFSQMRNKYNNDDDQQSGQKRERDRKQYGGGGYRKLFRTQNTNNKFNKFNRTPQENQTNIQEFVKNINQINKQFLGIKLNTDYFKVNNQKTFQEICKPDKSQIYKINDLPFSVSSKNQTQQQNTSKPLPNNTALKMLNKMISQQKLNKQLQSLASKYFTDLVSKQRKGRIQQNFEQYSRKVVQTLKSNKWNFRIQNKDVVPKVNLKSVEILKGIKVNRNDNYTVDSYNVNYDQQEQGVITYTLFKKQRQQYPQSEWFSQKFIVARIHAQISNCPIVEVNEQSGMSNSTKGLTHSFVFEVDLTVPPSLSFLSLTPQAHLNSYRLKAQNIRITNVDNKNVWYNVAYKQQEKKFRLINKII